MNPFKELDNLTNKQLKELAANCLTEQEKYYTSVEEGKYNPHIGFYMMHGGFKAIREKFKLPKHICPQP